MKSDKIDQIYQRGDHYDHLFGNDCPPFYLEVAQQIGGPILELACGTGRIAIPLAQAGLAVSGIDLSGSMLAEAQRKAAAAKVNLTLVEADMRQFDLSQRFALIFLANNALCHLLTLADFEACMRSVRRHLQPEGRFIVEVFVPSLSLLLEQPEERHAFAEYDDPAGRGRIIVTQTSFYDSATQIRHNRTYYRFPDREAEEMGELPMRMFFPQELDALFLYNGFQIEHKYGGFERQAFDGQASMQVLILKHRK